jgi:glycosyltransferase involved in cell wall biosynthesis
MNKDRAVHAVINYISLGHHHVARLRAITNKMTAKGWTVTCLEAFSKDSDYKWERYSPHIMGCRIKTVFKEESKAARSLTDFKVRINKVIDDLKPTIMVVSGYALPESHVIRRWCRSNKVPLILLMDSQEKDKKRNLAKEFIKRVIVSKHDAAFVAGESSARYAIKLGMRADRVWKGSCVVDNDYWQRRSTEIRSKSEYYRLYYELPSKYILSVSRFVSKKNLPLLINAFCEFEKNKKFGYKLVLVGDGPLKDRLVKTVPSEWKERILFRPFLQAEDLAGHYALASCFVSPSLNFEQWGLVVNEAMACRLPVLVSSACGCAIDLVKDGYNGYIFDPSDMDDLIKKLIYVTTSEKKRNDMGRNSLRVIGNFSCEWAAENLASAVDEVLNRSAVKGK